MKLEAFEVSSQGIVNQVGVKNKSDMICINTGWGSKFLALSKIEFHKLQ